MDCPKCSSPFNSEVFLGLSVDRCSHCAGLFCDADTLEKLKGQRLDKDGVDTGFPKDGKSYDKVGDIQCPSCAVTMDKISDPEQPHIWMEACPQCRHVFLDAGEINDLRYLTVFDKFRDLLKGKRK